MNRRTQMMVRELTTNFGYTEDEMDEFAWGTDDDLPEKYVMTFYDHNHDKRQFIHDNKTKVLTLYGWWENKWNVIKTRSLARGK